MVSTKFYSCVRLRMIRSNWKSNGDEAQKCNCNVCTYQPVKSPQFT